MQIIEVLRMSDMETLNLQKNNFNSANYKNPVSKDWER